eukprot:scaffold624_cov402-Prasinococcus_capsulatus_cf.AAC.64
MLEYPATDMGTSDGCTARSLSSGNEHDAGPSSAAQASQAEQLLGQQYSLLALRTPSVHDGSTTPVGGPPLANVIISKPIPISWKASLSSDETAQLMYITSYGNREFSRLEDARSSRKIKVVTVLPSTVSSPTE